VRPARGQLPSEPSTSPRSQATLQPDMIAKAQEPLRYQIRQSCLRRRRDGCCLAAARPAPRCGPSQIHLSVKRRSPRSSIEPGLRAFGSLVPYSLAYSVFTAASSRSVIEGLE
jgi:hypothetical protein